MKKNGFTLIEILTVVAIIGLISTLGLVAFQTSMKRARDARRISEVKALQNAAEQYYADNGNSYPPSGSPSSAVACFTYLRTYVQGFTIQSNTLVDPRGRAYDCFFPAPASAVGTYCIETVLEGTSTNDGNSAVNCSGTQISTTSRYYILRNLF